MQILWTTGNPMKFTSSIGANWTPAPTTGLAAVAGGFQVNSLSAASAAPTLSPTSGGFTVS
jgi:hypothetical protein